MSMNDINSLSHTKWNCKYHIVFAPKYRRKVFYREKRRAIGKILRQLCEWKGVRIITAEACPDHIHLFVEIPPKLSVSGFMGYLKGARLCVAVKTFGHCFAECGKSDHIVRKAHSFHGSFKYGHDIFSLWD